MEGLIIALVVIGILLYFAWNILVGLAVGGLAGRAWRDAHPRKK